MKDRICNTFTLSFGFYRIFLSVTLHNKFILSILYNVHYNFEPPQHQILDEFRPTEEAIIAHKKRLEIATMVSERKGPLYKSEIPTLDSSCKNNIFALKVSFPCLSFFAIY
jgi:hypothetical protein